MPWAHCQVVQILVRSDRIRPWASENSLIQTNQRQVILAFQNGSPRERLDQLRGARTVSRDLAAVSG